MSLARNFNLMDFRAGAKRRLPAPLFHYIDGAADDEWSLINNTKAFEHYQLLPNHLRDISKVDLSTKVLGVEMSMPVFCSPTGMTRLFHHGKELAVARAAARAGVMYTLSTLSTTSLEDVAAATAGPKMFQIYIFKDRELTREFVKRCKDAGYDALCLTVDTALAGNRERDKRTGMIMPPKLTLSSLASFAAHPHWAMHFLMNPDFRLANVVHRVDAIGGGAMGLIDYVNSQFDRTVTWEDAAWLVEQWGGPFAIKGLQTAEDAKRAVDIGASAIMISNHGGRQLDSAPAPIDCVAPMRDAVGDAIELIVDGGVRRGTHVLKALALGANACSFGRPYLYGLAAHGEGGVDRVLQLIREELERSIALLGCSTISQLGLKQVASSSSPLESRRKRLT
ncbi:alpha-hydroxy acid oxidase [Hyphomonas sp.]|uniref:alpha-hydroxy acid oxidase n=1 Tax=Hyphomonas sp. TaxID=87 RepID=UPI003D2AF637